MFDQTQQPNYGAPQMGAYNYNGYQAPMPKIMNALTDDEIKELQQQRSQFTLGLTERERLQSFCNHRAIGGMQDSLTYDQDTGLATCTICGYQFRPMDPDSSIADIEDACNKVVDILQTSKMMYVDLPANAAREYYQIIPLIGKLPDLFKFAAKNFAKHEFNSWNYNQHNMGGIAMLQNLNNMYGAPMNQPMGGYQQPMYQQPMMNNAMPGYPNAAYQQPVAGANAFGFNGASQMGYQPQTGSYSYQPGVAPQVAPTVAAPAAPADAAAKDTTVTQTVTV